MNRQTFAIFVGPSVFIMTALMIVPLLASIVLGFHYVTFRNLDAPVWLGLQNYQEVLADPEFWDSLEFTLIFIARNVRRQPAGEQRDAVGDHDAPAHGAFGLGQFFDDPKSFQRRGFRAADDIREVKLEQSGIAKRPRQGAWHVTEFLQFVARRTHLGQQANRRRQGIS